MCASYIICCFIWLKLLNLYIAQFCCYINDMLCLCGTSINSCNLSKMNCKKTFWRLQVSNNEFTGIKIYVFNIIKISSYVSYLVSSPHSEAFHHCKYGCTKKNKKIQMDTQHIPGFTSATLIFYLHLLMVCRTVICIRRN